ncbi:MAG: YihY/virulence factor BrkB family protein [Vicinamibacteria bacterium]|nr:YihY/virulence factor BrkB family protein [Vicinamibacteria bacterium]
MRAAFKHLISVVDMILSREIAVLTNAIAFNFLLCLFPLLLVVLAASHQLPGGERVGLALLMLLKELIPFEHEAIARSLRNLSNLARGLEIFSLLLIVWGSSGIFVPVEMALNRAWGGQANRSFWRSRSLAFFMTIAGGLLALISISLTVAARSYSSEWPILAKYSAKLSALFLTYVLFFLIYRFIPGLKVRLARAAQAALWGGTAWEVAKYFFVTRLPAMNLKTFYGPLAFSVALIIWAYMSSLALVFGALMVPTPAGKKRAA